MQGIRLLFIVTDNDILTLNENRVETAVLPPEGQTEGVCVIILLVELKGQEAGDGASLEPPHEEEANLIGREPHAMSPGAALGTHRKPGRSGYSAFA